MDMGREVTCNKCVHKFFMYLDTHGSAEPLTVIGMCPNCNTMVAKRLTQHTVRVYPPLEQIHPNQIKYIPYYGGA